MNAHLSLSHVNQDSTASILLGLTPAKGTCWHAAEATTPTRREPDASVRSDSSVWSGALTEEKVHFSSKKRVWVTSRFLNVFEEWEFAVCICCPSSSVICLHYRMLHWCLTAAWSSSWYAGWHCFWLDMGFAGFRSGVNVMWLLFKLVLSVKTMIFSYFLQYLTISDMIWSHGMQQTRNTEFVDSQE